MSSTESEKVLARYLTFGAFFTTIFVISGVVTDPVNVTKHFLLGITAFSSFGILLFFGVRGAWSHSKKYICASTIFILISIFDVFSSKSPLSQNLYGSFGRNTGFIAYLSLVLISLSALGLQNRISFKNIINALFAAGIVNVLYSLWAWQIGDFIGWTNPYGTILGTFGNPNFIGAFLGIFVSTLFAYSLQNRLDWKWRIINALTIIIGLLEIKHSHAIQGLVVSAAGFTVVGFYYIRYRFKSLILNLSYLLVAFVGGLFALLGALQIGPLNSLIYKTSVSLRGEYWNAGINMANKFPLTGVGFDSYGDWFRRMRRDSALTLPGPDVVSNAAHNVNIDILSYGGWPLFITYALLFAFTLVAITKIFLREKNYDPIFISMTVAWICYQLQAIISINQIGLAIWGWLFSGALIAYESATKNIGKSENIDLINKVKGKKNQKSTAVVTPTLVAGLGALIGALVAVPPLAGDMKWRTALQTTKLDQIEAGLVSGYLNPQNNYRYSYAIELLEKSKYFDLSYKYAKSALEFNPDNFDTWKVFYYLKNSTQSDKYLALSNLKRLDPKNPDVLKIVQ
mgnify:CR=1 FL=1